jgi:hypothetical protein
MHNIGLEYIETDSYGFRVVLNTFYAEILVMCFVLIHISSETKSGLLNVNLYEYESFTEGLDRYTKFKLLPDNNQLLNKY